MIPERCRKWSEEKPVTQIVINLNFLRRKSTELKKVGFFKAFNRPNSAKVYWVGDVTPQTF